MIKSKEIGRKMRRLRFEHGAEGGTHRKGWRVSKREAARLAIAYGPVATKTYSTTNVTNVTKGHNVTPREVHIDTLVENAEGNSTAGYAQVGL